MYGYVYLTTNLVNGKKYIGMHKSSVFDPNYKGSGKILWNAISKYGWENFKVEILKECVTKEDLYSAERYEIERCQAVTSREYYNVARGGQGGDTITGKPDYLDYCKSLQGRKRPPEIRRKISESEKGKVVSAETCFRVSESKRGEKHPFYGKHLTEEHRNNISKGNSNPSEETRQRHRDATSGRVWINDGVICKQVRLNGDLPEGWTFGMIRRKSKIRNLGRFWITNGTINRFIKDPTEIPEGWWQGCTRKKLDCATTIENITSEKDTGEEVSRVEFK